MWMPWMAFWMPDLKRLLLNVMICCMGGTLIALNNNTKEKNSYKRKQSMLLIPIHSLWPLIIIISFTLFWTMPIVISSGRLPLCARHRGDLPGLNTPYMHLFPSETHWHCELNKITLLCLWNHHLYTNFSI